MSLQKAMFTLQYEIPGDAFNAKCDYQIPAKAGFPYHEAQIAIGEHPNFPQLRASTWALRISGAEGCATLLPPLTLRAPKDYRFAHQLWGFAALSEISFGQSEFRVIPEDKRPLKDPVNWYTRSSCDEEFDVTAYTWKLHILFECGATGNTLAPRACLTEKVSMLYETGTLCDFKVVSSDGKEFPVHQTILAAWSPVFAAMFATAMKEKESGVCRLENFDGKVVNALLQFVYARPLPTMDDIAEDVLDLAEQYNIPELRTACEELLEKSITADNAPQYLHLAKLRKMSGLMTKVARFIVEHVNEF